MDERNDTKGIMFMRDEIRRFMQGFLEAKQQAFAGNSFGDFVRTEIPEVLYNTGFVNREEYQVKGSVGQGNWVTIPWIAILNSSITTTPQEGVYIVYLLSSDSKRLYLSFNQGCTKIRNSHSKNETISILENAADEIRLNIDGQGFSSEKDIELGDRPSGNGIFYEKGDIFHIVYNADEFPAEETLLDDLKRMMIVYADYVRFLNGKVPIGSFDSWTIQDENTAIKKCDKSFFDYKGSGVPKEICCFFDAENMKLGQVIPIKLIYQGSEFEGKIRNESSDRRRVRIFWNSDLSRLLAAYQNINTAKAIFQKIGDHVYQLTMKGDEETMDVKSQIAQIKAYIASKGFSYNDGLIENFYLSLKSKPFVILAGTSGTGKTRLVRLFAEAIGATFETIPVRPDWSDSTDLFGHVDLNGRFVPGKILDFLWQAQQDLEKPYILCLDEMNLARVEYYLSDFLSVIETREFKDGQITTYPLISDKDYGADIEARKKYGEICFPENLYIVGTVNMDETTFPFSRKVLDRANTIEFNYVELIPSWNDTVEEVTKLEMKNDFLRSKYLLLQSCPPSEHDYILGVCAELEKINKVLQKADAHVGYRVRDEIVFYLLNNKTAKLLDENTAMDNEILQKILPRIQGSSSSVKDMLCDLFKEIAGDYEGYQTASNNTAERMFDKLQKDDHIRYPRSSEKIAFMVRRFEEDGFTSYWL